MIYPISWAHAAPYLGAAFALAYLLGSIPFGLILTRLAGRGDIRAIGSGNIGATNVLRTGSKPLAAATLLLDAGKGAAAVSIAAWWGPDMEVVAALGALVGHLFPVWLRFRGGKGVATGLGILLGLSWPAGALACLVWLAVAGASRYSSLSALAAFGLAPVWLWLLADPQKMEFSILMAALVWLRHAGNVRRLLAGTEPRIGGAGG
ncbi:MAG: glycerol-3-phosphate 1-O-acyltransferase PlsY [Defluviicoccus sp.]|nr:glycerol-3-phosphate 1-O-acyltransferase PlsY [Defluviicoccus sp.]